MKDKSNDSNTDSTEPNKDSIGKPPADTTASPEPPAIDTVNAAVTVTTGMADLAGQAMGVEPVFAEAGEDQVAPDQIDPQALPSAAYGEFVKQVGLAVAVAQKALDDNSVAATKLLADTTIPALIAMNQVVNEDGEIVSIKPVIQQDSRLIQYIQPTFYQWSRVTLFARFNVSSFDAKGQTIIRSSSSTSTSSARAGGGLGFGLGGFSANLGGSVNRSGTGSQSATEIDTAFESSAASGTSFMLAVLEPRTDTRFPAPIIAIQGPNLTIASTANSLPAGPLPVAGQPEPPPPSLTLSITLSKKDSDFAQNDSKIVSVSLEGPGELGANNVTLTRDVDTKRLVGTVTLKRVDRNSVGTATVRVTLSALSSTVSINFPAPPAP